MMKHLTLLLFLLPSAVSAQNSYFFGLDIGPKFDQYKLATGGTRPYDPSINLRNDIGAMFGVSFGVLVEDKLMLESGIYRSNFRAIFDIVNEGGQKYFINTPVNTFTSFMLPFNLNVRKPIGRSEGTYVHLGGGFSTYFGTKRGITEVFYSHAEPVDPENFNKGNIAYIIRDNDFDAQLITLNLHTSFHFPVNEVVSGSMSVTGRLGVAGNNYVDIEHATPDYASIKNSFFTSGSGVQFLFGFRYSFTSL